MMRATILTPKLIDTYLVYQDALHDYLIAFAHWEENDSEAKALAVDKAWTRVQKAASDFRKLKAVDDF